MAARVSGLITLVAAAAMSFGFSGSASAHELAAKSALEAKRTGESLTKSQLSYADRYNEALNRRAAKNPARANSRFGARFADANEFIQFADEAAAFAWYNTFAPRFAQESGEPLAALVLPNDAKYGASYKHIREGVARIWESYKTLFPEQTAGLMPPQVLIRVADETNAFVVRDFDSERVVHAINVNTGMLEMKGLNDGQLFALIGHELAHSVFRHALTKYQNLVIKVYDRSKNAGKFSYEIPNDARATGLLASWINHSRFVGDLMTDAVQDLPTVSTMMPLYLNFMIQVVQGLPECASQKEVLKAWVEFQQSDSFVNGLIVTDEAGLASTTTKMRSGLMTCAKDVKMSLAKMVSMMTGVPEETVAAKLPKIEVETFDREENLAAAIFAATKLHRTAMKAIEAELPMKQMGIYGYEEHADDVAIIVMKHAGMDTKEAPKLFLNLLGSFAPEAFAQCNSVLAKGEEPPLGSLSLPHRASCYRADHLRKMAAQPSFNADIKAFAAQFLKATFNF